MASNRSISTACWDQAHISILCLPFVPFFSHLLNFRFYVWQSQLENLDTLRTISKSILQVICNWHFPSSFPLTLSSIPSDVVLRFWFVRAIVTRYWKVCAQCALKFTFKITVRLVDFDFSAVKFWQQIDLILCIILCTINRKTNMNKIPRTYKTELNSITHNTSSCSTSSKYCTQHNIKSILHWFQFWWTIRSHKKMQIRLFGSILRRPTMFVWVYVCVCVCASAFWNSTILHHHLLMHVELTRLWVCFVIK